MANLAFDTKFTSPFFSGASATAVVPGLYPVAINGRPYQVMWDHTQIGVWGAKFKRDSLPLLRAQADQSATAGEQSISPENFWRRSQENWISGAGQLQQDRKTSIETRFYTSKGINPWTSYQLSLLNSTTNKLSSANSNLYCVVAGSYVYVADGTSLKYSTDLTSWTAVTGAPSAITSICTDGSTIYTSHGTNGIYSTTAGTGTTASMVTGTVDLVRYVKGRLMAATAATGSVYNITAAGALPSVLFTKGSWVWQDMAGGQSQIYLAGLSGDKSLIYRTALLTDATALAAPIVAGELPDGEKIRSIASYLGYILIGSDLGVRFCSVNSDGSLTIGALITTTSPVYAMLGSDRFIWYTLTNYDATSTGLGRMDLTTFTSTLTPAYASDLMVTGQGTIRSIGTFNNLRIFTVDGKGLYSEVSGTPVSSGTLTTGWIGYGISDPKVAVFADLKHEPLNGTISVSMQTDGASQVVLGTSATQNSASMNSIQANQSTGYQYQLQFTLTPTANVSPKLTRWTLRSYPAPVRSSQFAVPVILHPFVETNGVDQPVDVTLEKNSLIALHKSQQVVSYQEGNQTYQVVMYDYQWLPEKILPSGDVQGIFLAYLNEITG